MTDRPRRPRSEWGDTERAAVGKPARGIPIPVHIDHEATPPPAAPPEPSSRDSYDSVPPPIREQIDLLHGAVTANAEALARVWDSRNDGQRLDRIESQLAGLTRAVDDVIATMREFVRPAISSMHGAVSSLEAFRNNTSGKQEHFWAREWPEVLRDVKHLDERLDRIERSLDGLALEWRAGRERHDATIAAHWRRMDDLAAQDLGVVARLAALERRHDTGDVALAGRVTALEQRNTELAAEQRGAQNLSTKQRAWLGAFIAIVSIAVTAVTKFLFH